MDVTKVVCGLALAISACSGDSGTQPTPVTSCSSTVAVSVGAGTAPAFS